MKKVLSLVLVMLSLCETAFTFPVDTAEWSCTPDQLEVSATEIDLKSDLKNSFRVFQTTIKNITNSTLDISLNTNKSADDQITNILNSGVTIKELMSFPKEIAVNSYNEDVGEGKVATAHKGLICILASAGAVATGAGLIGVYPQQKASEYFSHKKIRKEYKKITDSEVLTSEFTLPPSAEKDVILFVPINNSSCIINTSVKNEETDVYSDYHQL